MLVPVVVRMQEIMDEHRLNIPQFSEVLGYTSPQKIYRLFNTSNAWPSCQIIQDISRSFNQIDLNWLMMGEGTMFKDEVKSLDYKEKYFECLESKVSIFENAFEKQNIIFNLLEKITCQQDKVN